MALILIFSRYKVDGVIRNRYGFLGIAPIDLMSSPNGTGRFR